MSATESANDSKVAQMIDGRPTAGTQYAPLPASRLRPAVLWPIAILLIQLALLTTLWTVYGATSAKAKALPDWAVIAYDSSPQTFTYIVTQISTILSVISS